MNPTNSYHKLRSNMSGGTLSAPSSLARRAGKSSLANRIRMVKNTFDDEKSKTVGAERKPSSSSSMVRSLGQSFERSKQKSNTKEAPFPDEGATAQDGYSTSSQAIYHLAQMAINKLPQVLKIRWNESLELRMALTLYEMYAADKHCAQAILSVQEKESLFSAICEIAKKENISVSTQSDIPLESLIEDKAAAYNEFAFFIKPKVVRHSFNNTLSRISLALDSQKAQLILPFLADLVENESFISSAKIMGPNEQGNRPDSVVIYCTHPDLERAKAAAEIIQNAVGELLLPHTPMGMKSLLPGISYSEFSNLHPNIGEMTNSHGLTRAKILTKAIKSYAAKGASSVEELKEIIDHKFEKYGYNPTDNALINQSSDA